MASTISFIWLHMWHKGDLQRSSNLEIASMKNKLYTIQGSTYLPYNGTQWGKAFIRFSLKQ
jgi:hypothetical protein